MHAEEKISVAVKEVMGLVSSISLVSAEDAKKIIKRYAAGIEGNFIAWLSSAHICVKSNKGRNIINENLQVEIGENHPAMLRNFAKECNAEPNSEDFQYIEKEILDIRKYVSELSGVKNIALMACLESILFAVMPTLANFGKFLGCKDFMYTIIHGEVDEDHAKEFIDALNDEALLVGMSSELQESINLLVLLFKRIFTLDLNKDQGH